MVDPSVTFQNEQCHRQKQAGLYKRALTSEWIWDLLANVNRRVVQSFINKLIRKLQLNSKFNYVGYKYNGKLNAFFTQ